MAKNTITGSLTRFDEKLILMDVSKRNRFATISLDDKISAMKIVGEVYSEVTDDDVCRDQLSLDQELHCLIAEFKKEKKFAKTISRQNAALEEEIKKTKKL